MSSSVAFAWNQEYTSLTDPDAIGDCLDTAASPCAEWTKTSGNLSTTVYTLLGHFLSDEEVDLHTDAYNAIFTYNDIAARNPLLVQTTDSTIDELTITTTDQVYYQYGYTTNTIQASAPFHITKSVIKLNRLIVWNRTKDYGCSATVCHADARKVMNHEMGHAQGLGHEASGVAAIMVQGPVSYYPVQRDDINGITAIYGAYP